MLMEKTTNILFETTNISSDYLNREVKIDLYVPKHAPVNETMNLLLINDGQDLPQMPFDEILERLYKERKIVPVLCVGIHCGAERRMEYGIASQADYNGRGALASNYTSFIFEELLPFLQIKYQVNRFKQKAFAGFSLGGLMALDIVWNHPQEFSTAGVFSGSLWWRQKAYEDGYTDEADRIMHNQIRSRHAAPGLKFFFQTGLMDEKKDRNNNGIIDSIEDVLDLIAELKKKGYTDTSIKYMELKDGSHDVPTWGKAFPAFLEWGWGRK